MYPPLLFCLCPGCQPDHKQRVLNAGYKTDINEEFNHSIAYQWAEIALEATARDTERFKTKKSLSQITVSQITPSQITDVPANLYIYEQITQHE